MKTMRSAFEKPGSIPEDMNSAVALSIAVRDAVALGEERLVLMLRFSALPRARRLLQPRKLHPWLKPSLLRRR